MLSRRALTDDSSAAVDGAVLLIFSGAAFDIVHGAKLVSAKAASQGGAGANREFGDWATGPRKIEEWRDSDC